MADLQQQLHSKQQECTEASSSSRERAAGEAMLQQRLQEVEDRLLQQAQQRGQEQQHWQQQLDAALDHAHARVRPDACWNCLSALLV